MRTCVGEKNLIDYAKKNIVNYFIFFFAIRFSIARFSRQLHWRLMKYLMFNGEFNKTNVYETIIKHFHRGLIKPLVTLL